MRFLVEFSRPKALCITLYCILMNKTNAWYSVLDTSHSGDYSVLYDWAIRLNRSETILLGMCESCSGRFVSRAVSAMFRKELQTVFNNLFVRYIYIYICKYVHIYCIRKCNTSSGRASWYDFQQTSLYKRMLKNENFNLMRHVKQ